MPSSIYLPNKDDVSLIDKDANQEHNQTKSYSMMNVFTLANNQKYGLDVVFNRVQAEDILMLHDFNRIKKILTTFFVKSQQLSEYDSAISDPDALYLRRKYRTIERNHKNTFTELFLSNLVHLLPDEKGGIGGEFGHRSRPGKNWKKSRGKIEFLPDLQKTDVVYSKEDVDSLKTFLQKQRLHKTSCTLVEVRAGIFLQNESLLNLAEVLKENKFDFQFYVRSEPYDTLLDVNALSSAMKIVGENRLVVDFPADLHKELQKLSTQISTPGVRKTSFRKNVGNGIDRSDNVLSSAGSGNNLCISFEYNQNRFFVMFFLLAIFQIFS